MEVPERASLRELAAFVAVAFGGSWGLAATAYLAGIRLTPITAMLIGLPYMLFPAVAAIAVTWREGPRSALGLSFRPNRWWLVGWLSPFGLAALTFVVGLCMPGTSLARDADGMLARFHLPPEQLEQARQQLSVLPLWALTLVMGVQALVAGATINALAALGEELGWRGYLQQRLGLGFWKSAWVVGLIWGPWHAGLVVQGYNYPTHPWAGVGMMTVLTVLLSPLLAAVRRFGGSTVAAAIAHGTVNATAGFATLYLAGGADLLVGVTGLSGLVALLLANVALWVWMRVGDLGSS